MRRVIRGGGALLVVVSALLVVAGCGTTPQEEADAEATTPTTADDNGPEQAVPPGGLADAAPEDAEAAEPATSTTAPGTVAIQPAPNDGTDIRIAQTRLGDVLVDADGFTLYGYTGDSAGIPTCNAACAETWPAVLADDDLTVSPALDEDVFTSVDAASGRQLKAGRWPLYRFDGDTPGDARGQAVGDMFYAVQADGTLVRPA